MRERRAVLAAALLAAGLGASPASYAQETGGGCVPIGRVCVRGLTFGPQAKAQNPCPAGYSSMLGACVSLSNPDAPSVCPVGMFQMTSGACIKAPPLGPAKGAAPSQTFPELPISPLTPEIVESLGQKVDIGAFPPPPTTQSASEDGLGAQDAASGAQQDVGSSAQQDEQTGDSEPPPLTRDQVVARLNADLDGVKKSQP